MINLLRRASLWTWDVAERFIPRGSSPAIAVKGIRKPESECNAKGEDQLHRRDMAVESSAYDSLLRSCSNLKVLREAHAHLLVNGFNENLILGTKLVSMYELFGSLADARLVFDKLCLFERNAFLWNVMIRGYAWNGLCQEALALYRRMGRAGIQPDGFTFSVVLKACAGLSGLQEGKETHGHFVRRRRFESDVFVGSALVDMYCKCVRMDHARQVFDKMSKRDVVSWNSMIAGYVQGGDALEALALCHRMGMAGVKPDRVTIVCGLPACAELGSLQHGKEIHDYVIRNGLEGHAFVTNALVDMYAKCGRIEVARHVFDKMLKRDVVSWNAMIAGCVSNGQEIDALELFHEMQVADATPNSITMASVIPAFAHLGDLQQGKGVHGYIIRRGFELDVAVATSLIDMYSKCGSIQVAHQLFSQMPERDLVSWNAMIAGYAQNGHGNESLRLFHQMQQTGVKPNSVTMVNVLSACTYLTALQEGKRIHDYIRRNGFESDVSVGNSLVTMYGKCGSMDIACQVFNKISKMNVVSWNAMIVGYVQNGHANEALALFRQMQLAGSKPNSVTMVSVLPACAHLATLEQGKSIHDYIIRNGLDSDVSVRTALINMYAKCGSIEAARRLFDRSSVRDVVSWSTMIAGYGMHGHTQDALALFSQMQQMGMKPDHITFIGLLCACAHAGLVDEGWLYFHCMSRDYCIVPKVEHYACMVDLLGRAGHLNEAEAFIRNMPLEPDAGVWGALLGACRIHGNAELAKHVSEHLLELESKHAGTYVLLSNIYMAAGRWDDAVKVRTMLRDKGLKKSPGCSWIEIRNSLQAFRVEDRLHPQYLCKVGELG